MMKAQIDKPLHTKVLIVGGGVTGLSAALFLLKQGITPLLIERHPSTSIHPRARGFDTRTMELFREIELSEQIRDAGKALSPSWGILTNKSLTAALAKRKVKQNNKVQFPSQMKWLTSLAKLSPEVGARCTQDLSEPVLLETAKARGAQIFLYTEMLSFSQSDEGVTAVIRNRETGEQQIVNVDYMIAADGAKSGIREILRSKTSGRGALGNLLNIYFEADLAAFVRGREFSILRMDEPDVKGFLSSINNSDRWAFQLYYDPQKETYPDDFKEEKLIAILQKVIGLPDIKVRIISVLPWQPTVKVVEEMQQGRIFLAGDAAHVMTPYGGKGANTGIQDVHNLAWKLAVVLYGKAGSELLRTYSSERRPVGWHYATQSGKMGNEYGLLKKRGVKFMWPFLSVMLINILHLQKLFPKRPLWNLGYLMGLPNYRYVSSAVVSKEKPVAGFVKIGLLQAEPGTRMPHLWIEHQGEKISTLDLLGNDFVLFTIADNTLWEKISAMVGEKFNIKIPVYAIGKERTPIFAGMNTLKTLGISDTGAILVRPDGFVAWREPAANTQSLKGLEEGMIQILSKELNGQKKHTKTEETAW